MKGWIAIVVSLGAWGAVGAEAAEPDGGALYQAHCAACHQADGRGAIGLAPPLVGTLKRYLDSDAGKQFLAQIAVAGMAGKVEHSGVSFVGVMPGLKDQLSDAQIAATVNFALTQFNAAAGVVTAEQVAKARAAAPSMSDTYKLRATIK